jgi:hypothetical protein
VGDTECGCEDAVAVSGQSFGEEVCDVVLSGDVGEVDGLGLQLLADEVVLDIDGLMLLSPFHARAMLPWLSLSRVVGSLMS